MTNFDLTAPTVPGVSIAENQTFSEALLEILGDAVAHLKTMFGLSGAALTDPAAIYYFKHNLAVLAAAALACIPWKALLGLLPKQPVKAAAFWLKPIAVTVLLLLSVALMVGQSYNPFLYFRF